MCEHCCSSYHMRHCLRPLPKTKLKLLMSARQAPLRRYSSWSVLQEPADFFSPERASARRTHQCDELYELRALVSASPAACRIPPTRWPNGWIAAGAKKMRNAATPIQNHLFFNMPSTSSVTLYLTKPFYCIVIWHILSIELPLLKYDS